MIDMTKVINAKNMFRGTTFRSFKGFYSEKMDSFVRDPRFKAKQIPRLDRVINAEGMFLDALMSSIPSFSMPNVEVIDSIFKISEESEFFTPIDLPDLLFGRKVIPSPIILFGQDIAALLSEKFSDNEIWEKWNTRMMKQIKDTLSTTDDDGFIVFSNVQTFQHIFKEYGDLIEWRDLQDDTGSKPIGVKFDCQDISKLLASQPKKLLDLFSKIPVIDLEKVTTAKYLFAEPEYGSSYVFDSFPKLIGTENITNASGMFYKVNTRVRIAHSGFKNVQTAIDMFNGFHQSNLSDAPFTGDDFKNVVNAIRMFRDSNVFESYDIGQMNFNKVVTASSMFALAKVRVSEIHLPAASNVIDMFCQAVICNNDNKIRVIDCPVALEAMNMMKKSMNKPTGRINFDIGKVNLPHAINVCSMFLESNIRNIGQLFVQSATDVRLMF